MWKFKRFFRRIKNTIQWLPVIWKDDHYDSYFFYNILHRKLFLMLKYREEPNEFDYVDSKADYDKIKAAMRLVEICRDEEYVNACLDQVFPLPVTGDTTQEEWALLYKVEEKQDKARRLLFKLLNYNVEKWWF